MRHWIPIDHYRTIDSGFICCWLDVKRIARSKSPSNDKWLLVTRNEYRGGDQVHDFTYALHIPYHVQVFLNRVDWRPSLMMRVTFEGLTTWSDNFFCCQWSNTPEHYAADMLAPQPVCYVRRGNLLFPRVGPMRWSFESHPQWLYALVYSRSLRCDGNWGWNCSFWTDSNSTNNQKCLLTRITDLRNLPFEDERSFAISICWVCPREIVSVE